MSELTLELPNTVVGWLSLMGLMFGAIAFAVASWKRGRANALAVAHEELEVVNGRANRLATDLNEARVKCAEDIAFLSGKVERLEAENAQMSDRLSLLSPEVLLEGMARNAKNNRDYFLSILDDRLLPIREHIDDLHREVAGIREGGTE